MSKFICKNKKCKNFEKEIEVATLNWPYERESKRIKDMQCKECGKQMKSKPFESSYKAPAHAKFASLPDTEKKKILKKRAADEYKKSGGAEQKLLKQREAIKNFGGN